jgi:hypothetical protein
MICILTFCMRSPTGLIIVSPAPRGGDWILPNLNTMPCSNCCTTRTERPTAITPNTTSTATMIKMISTIANSPSRATRARYGPGPVPNLRHARYRRRCLLIRTTASGSSAARPQMTSRRGRNGHRLAGCAVARRHRQRGAAASATAAPRGQRSWPGSTRPKTPAGAGSSRRAYPAGHVISVTVMTGPAAAGRSHVLCARRGMNLRPYRRRRRQCDAGAGERQRRQTAPELGVLLPLSGGELAIDRQRIVGDLISYQNDGKERPAIVARSRERG